MAVSKTQIFKQGYYGPPPTGTSTSDQYNNFTYTVPAGKTFAGKMGGYNTAITVRSPEITNTNVNSSTFFNVSNTYDATDVVFPAGTVITSSLRNTDGSAWLMGIEY